MPSIAHANVKLRASYAEGRLKEALHRLLTTHNPPVNLSTYLQQLQTCVAKKTLSEGKQVHSLINDRGFAFPSDTLLQNTLISMYDSKGLWDNKVHGIRLAVVLKDSQHLSCSSGSLNSSEVKRKLKAAQQAGMPFETKLSMQGGVLNCKILLSRLHFSISCKYNLQSRHNIPNACRLKWQNNQESKTSQIMAGDGKSISNYKAHQGHVSDRSKHDCLQVDSSSIYAPFSLSQAFKQPLFWLSSSSCLVYILLIACL
ncbi:hypothetical protein SUGI_0492630 [Cryptomeria japonica]|nr:hypothetical protein SUGI_0492630 [Cryptomeria japonica]